MNQLRQKSTHKDNLKSFMNVTSVTEKQATRILQQYNWNLDHAIDAFFLYQSADIRNSLPAAIVHSFSDSYTSNGIEQKKIEQLFNRYKDPKRSDRISATGMERFLVSDLQLDPSSLVVLTLAWRFRAKIQCEFTKKEFIDGMTSLDCDSIDKLKSKIPHLTELTKDPMIFKQIYLFAFNFAKVGPGRHLEIELAIPYWQLLLGGLFRHLELWFEFLQVKQVKFITKDVWDMLLELVVTIDDKLVNYDIEGAYPVLIDEFIVYGKTRL